MKETINGIFGFLSALFIYTAAIVPALAVEPKCPGSSNPDPAVIWCDDFDNSVSMNQKYFDYDNGGGEFLPVAGTGIDGSTGMQVIWQTGEDNAGNFKRTFGRSPVNSQSHSNQDFPEIYWREYIKMQQGWTGNPYKLSRATIFSASNWAQAMIAHVWGDGAGDSLVIDPATGVNSSGNVVTTSYNDFAHLQWLGLRRGTTPIFSSQGSGKWYCIEARVNLNTPGASDGIFELWIDDRPEASRTNLNWVGTWQGYGINAIAFENYWNGGAPGPRIRHLDNIVISTKRIGCLSPSDIIPPSPPTGLRVQ